MDLPRALERIAELEQLVASLTQQLATAHARIATLEAERRQFDERMAELERAAARQAAPFRRPEQRKIPPAQQKRPGRKPGHPGFSRAVPLTIDEEIEVTLPNCPRCGGKLRGCEPLVQVIEEIPPLRPHVVRLTTWQGQCRHCGPVHSTHSLQTSRAGGAAGVQLGPRAQGLAVLLNKHLGLTMRKTCAVLHRLAGLRVTAGGVAQLLARVARRVVPSYQELLEQLRGSPAVFADETSWWVNGPKWWLWVFTNPNTTVYRVEQRRNAEVVNNTLGDYAGMLVSDCLNSYDSLDCRKHKCVAHHLRAIRQARDRPDTPDPSYLDHWQSLFKTVCVWHRLRATLPVEMFDIGKQGLASTCARLLAQEVTQPGDVAVRNRLLKQQPHLLGCLQEPAAEPTNNRAERALRPAVIARKLSCGNKTLAGKQTWEILASLTQTCAQRGQDFITWLTPKLQLASVVG
jgi:hypothetical protein